ncbi:hypothetical protein O9993_15395 [Vibrio lentus]|nr:hypothetical protein [Vibrio lentus]
MDLSATEEISIEDFELLFASGGLLDAFIDKNFALFMTQTYGRQKQVEGEIMPPLTRTACSVKKLQCHQRYTNQQEYKPFVPSI